MAIIEATIYKDGSATRSSVNHKVGDNCVGFKTAESYRVQVMKKPDIYQVAGLVRYAIRQRLLHP